jgi:hypothetical protein
VVFFLLACGKKGPDKAEDIGVNLELSLQPDTLTDFLFIKMNYNFKVEDTFKKLDKNYMVFVHFWRLKNKELFILDDHLPGKPTSEWKTGDEITYSREFFLPKFLDELDIDFEGYEEVKLSIGLYDSTNHDDKKVLYSKILNVQPASINAPDIVFSEGWNEEEMNLALENTFQKVWRWTRKKAECIIENPKKKSILIIKGGLKESIYEDQKISVTVNDIQIDEFISEKNFFEKRYTLTPEQMGDEAEFKLYIESSKTFIPSSLDPKNRDNRELGIQIFLLYFREV